MILIDLPLRHGGHRESLYFSRSGDDDREKDLSPLHGTNLFFIHSVDFKFVLYFIEPQGMGISEEMMRNYL